MAIKKIYVGVSEPKEIESTDPMYDHADMVMTKGRMEDYITTQTTPSLETVTLEAQSADPADPAEGYGIVWLSDGTGSGTEGQLMMKYTSSSGTATTSIDMTAI